MELRFVPSESTFSYFEALESYLGRHGRPVAFADALQHASILLPVGRRQFFVLRKPSGLGQTVAAGAPFDKRRAVFKTSGNEVFASDFGIVPAGLNAEL